MLQFVILTEFMLYLLKKKEEKIKLQIIKKKKYSEADVILLQVIMSYQKDSHLSSHCTAGNGIEQLCSSNTCTYLGSSVILLSQAELFFTFFYITDQEYK